MLSPVILTFYLAVVPTFIRSTWPRSACWLLAAVHVTIALACHSAWVLALDRMRTIFQRQRPRRSLCWCWPRACCCADAQAGYGTTTRTSLDAALDPNRLAARTRKK